MKGYMLDTSTVSFFLKGNPEVTRRVVDTPMATLCISVITEAELLFGLAKRPQAKRLHRAVGELLRRIEVLPWESAIAERYGPARAAMESTGKVLAPLDLLIATHAMTEGKVLVTNDSAFSHVDDLQLEDWTAHG